jgi:hypothetical protein
MKSTARTPAACIFMRQPNAIACEEGIACRLLLTNILNRDTVNVDGLFSEQARHVTFIPPSSEWLTEAGKPLPLS